MAVTRSRTDIDLIDSSMSSAPPLLELGGVPVADTFAEAFPITCTRLVITALTEHWATVAATEFCGFSTSVIACDVEAAIETRLLPEQTPDGRPGISVLVFAFSRDGLAEAVTNRVGQCILTCPTTACYNGIENCPKKSKSKSAGSCGSLGMDFKAPKNSAIGDSGGCR